MQKSAKEHSRLWEQQVQKSCGRSECVEETFEGQCDWNTLRVRKIGEIRSVGNI